MSSIIATISEGDLCLLRASMIAVASFVVKKFWHMIFPMGVARLLDTRPNLTRFCIAIFG